MGVATSTLYSTVYANMRHYVIGGGQSPLLTLGGIMNKTDVIDFMTRVQFDIVDTNFGPGRAGAQRIGSDGLIHIEINATQFLEYANRPGGLNYLITHEIAHAIPAGQTHGQNMFNQWLAADPARPKMTREQQSVAYAGSPQFIQHEQYANSNAKSIADAMHWPTMSDPQYGYM